ncbi:MAG: riboflavin biosynthesis protein RibF [Lentisphaerae bacterium]|nr:riboflavin biosynthesis protein RibF [Lentisphaerota bacterium]
MHTLIQPDVFRGLAAPVVLAAGFFDGVHLGHRRVLDAAIVQARASGGQAWALTFDQHPLAVLDPQRRPPLLTPIEHRLGLLGAAGIDGCLMIPFTRELADCTPADFIAQITDGPCRPVSAVCCGASWRFGRHAAGTPDWLRAHGIAVTIVPAARHADQAVSSTRIREAIRSGDLAAAATMLGRPYAICETVRHGRGVARTLGMATANIQPEAEVLPPIGVYAVRSAIGDRPVEGVANLGFRPTFPEAQTPSPILEVHLFDFAGDLYSARIDIAFIARIRDECVFPSPAALAAQIRADCEAARTALRA